MKLTLEKDFVENFNDKKNSFPLNKSSPNFCEENKYSSTNPRFKYLGSNLSTDMNKSIKSKTHEMNQHHFSSYNDYFTDNLGYYAQQRYSNQNFQGNFFPNIYNEASLNFNNRKSNISNNSNNIKGNPRPFCLTTKGETFG
mgnify:CR=1 FL=1